MEEARGEKDKLPKKRKGVPPLFVSNPDFRRDFLDNIRLGLNIDDSCHLAGCHPSSFDLWKQKANKGILKDIEFDGNFVKVDENNMTSIKGVFAGGDIIGTIKTVAWAAKDGHDAAKKIEDFIIR